MVFEMQVYTLKFQMWYDKPGEICDNFCDSVPQFGVGMWLLLMFSQEGVKWH
jgi:hypothetical protein